MAPYACASSAEQRCPHRRDMRLARGFGRARCRSARRHGSARPSPASGSELSVSVARGRRQRPPSAHERASATRERPAPRARSMSATIARPTKPDAARHARYMRLKRSPRRRPARHGRSAAISRVARLPNTSFEAVGLDRAGAGPLHPDVVAAERLAGLDRRDRHDRRVGEIDHRLLFRQDGLAAAARLPDRARAFDQVLQLAAARSRCRCPGPATRAKW